LTGGRILEPSRKLLRFGAFDVDLDAGELRKQGLRLRLQEQPFQVLTALLERPGEVVTREELVRRLWPDGTFVDFDRGLNAAVTRLRQALSDSADAPKYVETVARRGYRFIGPPVSQATRRHHPVGPCGGRADCHPRASLAVLPLVNSTGDPETDYFIDGITETIINSLARLPQLRVITRTTVFRYKGTSLHPQDVGRELAVGAVLTGRVAQRGDNVRVQVELVDVAYGVQLWGERFYRRTTDIFSIEEDIALEISHALRLRLTEDEEAQIRKRPTESKQAYQLYLKGRYHWNRRSLLPAIGYLEQALENDPEYALAWPPSQTATPWLGPTRQSRHASQYRRPRRLRARHCNWIQPRPNRTPPQHG